VCGIAGVFDRSGLRPSTELLVAMRDVMVQRGPDDCGVFSGPGIGLAHRRLSIIDLSAAGRQPMANEDETVWITFNGEIYDFADVRAELVAAGHRFRSATDTEVLLHGYEEWGLERLLRRVQGMFAFALWDARRQTLFLARDRLGKKPLFYAEIRDRVYFSSDVKSIWIAARDRLSIDPEALDEFLHFYFVTQDRSIFREVKKVPPGAYVELGARHAHTSPYWTVDFAGDDRADENEWLERCSAALRTAVRRRMIADVPLGAFLSGGVDSSLVVALMAEASARPIKTFSIGFAEATHDELPYARRVAERYQTEHHELRVQPDVWEILPQLVWQYGEPFGDSSAVPSSFVAKMARQEVKVALSGDGGDEAFAGYPSYAAVHRGERCWWVPRWVRDRALTPIGRAAHERWPDWHAAARLKSLGDNFSGDPLRPLDRDMAWNGPRRHALYSDAMRELLDGWQPVEAQASHLADGVWRTPTDGWRLTMLRSVLPADYLVKIDVASMMSSLEVRCPFLDTELIELTARIPTEILLGPRNRPKSLLKRLADDLLPGECVKRSKQGFALPIEAWIRGPWMPAIRRLLLSERALQRGYFRRNVIDEVLRQHAAGVDHQHRIWCLLWLELWHLLFIDGTLSPDDRLPLQ
jgi:asparagine synthase (glutamine-hydrolysing)